MYVEAQLVKVGEFYQIVDLGLVGDTALALALKKNQFDLIKGRSQLGHIRDDLIRIDVRGRCQLKGKSSPIISQHR